MAAFISMVLQGQKQERPELAGRISVMAALLTLTGSPFVFVERAHLQT